MGLRVGALSHHVETITARAKFLATKRLRQPRAQGQSPLTSLLGH
jgi:hypothetical protein